MTANKKKSNKLLLLSHIWTFIAGLLLAVLLPKVLVISEYIIAMKVIALIGILIPVCSFAVPTFLIRQYNNSKGNELVIVIGKLLGIGFFISIITLLFFNLFSQFGIYNYKILIAIIVFLSAGLNILGASARMQSDAILYFHAIATSKIITILFVCVCYIMGNMSVDTFLEIWLLSLIITILIASKRVKFSYLKLIDNKKSHSFDVLTTRSAFIFCYPIVISNCLIVIIPLIERILLPSIISENDLALYVFNMDVFGKIGSIFLLVLKVIVFPSILKVSKREQYHEYIKYFKVLLFLEVIIFLVTMIFVTSFGCFIYTYFGLNGFFDPIVILIIVAIFIISTINYMFTIGLAIVGDNKVLLVTTAITLISHTIGMIFIGREFGVQGIAFSYLLSVILSSVILGFFSFRKLNVFEKNNFQSR